MITAKPWRASVWVPVVVALGLLALFVVPALPGLASTTRPVEPGERVTATTASFAPAQGWTLDLDAAVSSRPVVTSDGVTVRLSDGVWFGSSADLLARMAELLEEAGATVGQIPDAPSDDALVTLDPAKTPTQTIPRTEYVIDFTLGSDPGELMVVREDVGVALLRTTGPAAAMADHADDIAAMKSSVDVGVVSVDDVPRDPQVFPEAQGAPTMKEIARRSATVRLWNPGNPGWWLLVVFTAAGAWVLATGLAPAFQRFAVTGALAVLLSAPMFVLVWFLVKGMQIVTRPARSAALAAVIWGAVVATGVFALNANGAIILLLAQHVSLDFANEWGAAIAAPLTEETGKLLGVVAVIFAARSWLRTAMDGLLLGALVGLGFLLTENVIYAFNITTMSFGESQPIATLVTYLLRTGLFWPVSHAIFTAFTGAALGFLFGRPQARRYGWGLLCLALAYGVHFLWNSPVLPGILSRMAFATCIPFLLWLVIHLARRAEHAWVATVLNGEVEAGTLPREWAEGLGGTLRARRRRRREAVGAYGPAAKPVQRTHEALLVDLADAVDAGDQVANDLRTRVRLSLEEGQRRAAEAARAQAEYQRQLEEYRRYWAERGYQV